MPMQNSYVQYQNFARTPAASSPQAIGALRLGRALLMISCFCLCGQRLLAQTSDSSTADERNNSWTATTDFKSNNLLSTRIPVRITESHRKDGNRTFEERSVEVQGVDGNIAPYQEIETETLQVDPNTVRTTRRTFGQDVNGAKSLIQVTEEEKHTLPGGGSNVLRITFNPDVNGKLQPVQREMAEIKTIAKDVEETNTTVMLPNINGGLAPVLKTHEIRKQRSDGATESQKTTFLADGAGKWELSETRQVSTTPKGENRTVEERIFRRDAEGKLSEVSRQVTEESNSNSGKKSTIVDSYSLDVPGTTRDGNLHLVERSSASSQTNASGRRITENKIERVNPGDPNAGLGVSILINDEMVPGPSGEQSTLTIRARDSNGGFGTVAVDTTKSDRIPTVQIQPTPSGNRNE